MKLKFTHKTWYFFLLCAAAASMLNGFAVLGGMDFSFLEMVAFCITGITILFLAAEKGSDPKDKLNYFGVFVVLMLSYVINGWAAYICSALVWPALLALEYQKGRPIQRQLQLVGAAEAFHLLFVLLTVYGGMAGLSFWANLLWVLRGMEKVRSRVRPWMTALLAVFMAVNMLTSALALARYDARTSGEGPKNSIDTLLDDHFDDVRMERIYPNAKKVTKAG